MDVVIRADGGPDVGYGHLVRTGALAERLLARGDVVRYATTTPAAVADVCPDDVGVVDLPDGSVDALCEHVDASGPDVVVLDSYDLDATDQRTLRDRDGVLAIVDDTGGRVCADVVVNGNLYAESLDYEVVGDPPTWCLGPEYLLLREEVRRLVARDPPSRDPPERLLVTMGGSDVSGDMPVVVRVLDGLALTLDVVIGPGFTNADAVREAVDAVSTDVRIHRDPPDFLELVYDVDLAVSACGSTVYELLALGTPFVGVVQADNQRPIADGLRERQLATVAGRPGETDAIRSGVERLRSDPELRRARRNRGREVVDGRGVERVDRAIRATVGRNPQAKT